MQEDLPARRGRPLKELTHPVGRLIRHARIARGWSIAKLADAVGIGESTSLMYAIEHGRIPPRLPVALRLAEVLGLPEDPLREWAEQARYGQRDPFEVEKARRAYDEQGATLRLWRESASPYVEWAPGATDPAVSTTPVSRDDIPIYAAGLHPDRPGARPMAYLARAELPPSLAGTLVRPVAFVVSDDDFERLRRPEYRSRRPRYAVVSRPPIESIDPREPYAVRRHGRVLLAYVGWDGRELFILPPFGKPGFARASAPGLRGFRDRVIGQVVSVLGWI